MRLADWGIFLDLTSWKVGFEWDCPEHGGLGIIVSLLPLQVGVLLRWREGANR